MQFALDRGESKDSYLNRSADDIAAAVEQSIAGTQ